MEGTVNGIGCSLPRKEAPEKVTGVARYNTDFVEPGLLHAWLVTSLYAHALIKGIDYSAALSLKGVHAVVTGAASPKLTGPVLEDRPILALDKVRYFGEPIAVVVADSEALAKQAADLVKVQYQPLPVVHSPGQALGANPPLVHPNLAGYTRVKPGLAPKQGTNIASHIKVRKGDLTQGWAQSEVTVEAEFSLPQSAHAQMEPRNVRAEIKPNGQVIIHSATQAPFTVRKFLSQHFSLDESKLVIYAPLIGGAFGGKTAVQLEYIAYLASWAVNGKPVKLVETREQDFTSSPCHLGMEARVKLGATRDGKITAAEFNFVVDTGAYTDSGPKMTRAMAADCTGPYRMDNVWCDALCVFTNHTYVTAFRGFGRLSYIFALERTLDKLAFALGMDPLILRQVNALKPGDTTPTMARLTKSNIGNLGECLERLKTLINWDEGIRVTNGNKVRAKGISCFWKSSSSPPNATSAVILILNKDGTINLLTGAVEFGEGTKTVLAQILAEKLRMNADRIHVMMDVSTEFSPVHWKTVASMTTYMAGNAVLEAAEDLIRQLKDIAAVVLRCPAQLLEVEKEMVYVRSDPEIKVLFSELANGYEYPEGSSVGGQIVGRGNFIMTHLNPMEQNTGKGQLGPAWTVGAQAVEVELDTADFSYRLLRAATVVDAGKVLNPKNARGVITGGMCMGLGYGGREYYHNDCGGIRQNPQFRNYHLLRYGEQPEYLVDFVETPQLDAPYGQRGLGEHGIVGIPAALANALSSAAQADLHQTPITPESIWRTKGCPQ